MYLIYQSICLRDHFIMSYLVSTGNQPTNKLKKLIISNKTYHFTKILKLHLNVIPHFKKTYITTPIHLIVEDIQINKTYN